MAKVESESEDGTNAGGQEANGPAAPDPPRGTFRVLANPALTDHGNSTRMAALRDQYRGRLGLGAYIADPGAFPTRHVVFYDEHFVAIRDLYPKSFVHCLLLPRSAERNMEHPFDALDGPVFLASVRAAAARLRTLVAAELRRQLGSRSAGDAYRDSVLSGDVDPPSGDDELPPGRDWEREVRVGVHAVPSMTHLHIHVLSRDMHSPHLKTRNHYNSFNTPFFVELDAFPLPGGDPRRHPGQNAFIHRSMRCWRCGRQFGRKIQELKVHLEAEFDEWARE